MIRIAIADDHTMVIKGLQIMLEDISDMQVEDIYENGALLLEGLKKRQPDVLVLDIYMPGISGEELAPLIAQSYPGVRILTLSNIDQTAQVQHMIENGALGYLLKSAGQELLTTAIRSVHRGKQFIDPALREQLLEDMLVSKKEALAVPELSPREQDILQMIANDRTSQEIADALFLSKRTIDHYRISLLVKFNVKSPTALIKKALQSGLIQ